MQPLESVYLGGGTPSMISPTDLAQLFIEIKTHFSIGKETEITLEVNPDDLNPAYLTAVKDIGINRLSIGIQSFDDELLKFLNRRHTSKQAIVAIDSAVKAGFENISIDLIYGIPGLSHQAWEDNLKQAICLPAVHISAYHLTIENETPFGRMRKTGMLKEIGEEDSLFQYNLLCDYLVASNFDHYEISNFAKNGMISHHNSSYWSQKPYLGFGPSAHSYLGSKRCWNISDLSDYIALINAGSVFFDCEQLSIDNQYNEYLLTRLRTNFGCSMHYIEKNFGSDYLHLFEKQLSESGLEAYFIIRDDQIFLKKEFWFVSDSILARLFKA